jgi:hypothetical protein
MVKPIDSETVNDGIEIPSMSQGTREGFLPAFDPLAHPVTCGEAAVCRTVNAFTASPPIIDYG